MPALRSLPLPLVAVFTLWWWMGVANPAQAQPIPVECRLGQGAWQTCLMDIQTPGAHWFLLVGGERMEFQHDGSGRMRRRRKGIWQDVTPRWGEDQSLCWDGVCVRGEIPLD